MHGEPDGLLREEGYYMIFTIVRIEKWCALEEINSLMDHYSWPVGHKPPPIHASVLKGTRGTVPES
eukprot:3923874-Pleurochrysis_carterae.AAC.1